MSKEKGQIPQKEQEYEQPDVKLFFQLTVSDVQRMAFLTVGTLAYAQDLGSDVCYQRSQNPQDNPIAIDWFKKRARLDFLPEPGNPRVGSTHLHQESKRKDTEKAIPEYGIVFRTDSILLVAMPRKNPASLVISCEVMTIGKKGALRIEQVDESRLAEDVKKAAMRAENAFRKDHLLT